MPALKLSAIEESPRKRVQFKLELIVELDDLSDAERHRIGTFFDEVSAPLLQGVEDLEHAIVVAREPRNGSVNYGSHRPPSGPHARQEPARDRPGNGGSNGSDDDTGTGARS